MKHKKDKGDKNFVIGVSSSGEIRRKVDCV